MRTFVRIFTPTNFVYLVLKFHALKYHTVHGCLHYCSCVSCRDNDVVNDPAVKQTVVEQTKHWSEMIDRHQKENWELMKAHLQAQEEVLKKLMQSQQQLQIKELEAFFEK